MEKDYNKNQNSFYSGGNNNGERKRARIVRNSSQKIEGNWNNNEKRSSNYGEYKPQDYTRSNERRNDKRGENQQNRQYGRFERPAYNSSQQGNRNNSVSQAPRRNPQENENSSFRKDRKFPSSDRQYENRGGGYSNNNRQNYNRYPEKRDSYDKKISNDQRDELKQKHYSKKKVLAHRLKQMDESSELRLNRYISMGGVCSRRDADELIKAGRVKVNGVIVHTVGQKVTFKDRVEVDGVQIIPEKKIYLVLNKPKDYVTTVEDPLERKTVMSLIENACKERVYPVGRLDRQTTGVLLFTNDGDLAKKLTHPKYAQKKIYHVFLDKPLLEEDMNKIKAGVELEDGFIKPDEISYVASDYMEVGIEIHSGKNRIVRRIFEHFGYQIVKLDRVYFAGITKKNIPRGKWRFLTSREVNMLKVY